jgi:hypothetical protein
MPEVDPIIEGECMFLGGNCSELYQILIAFLILFYSLNLCELSGRNLGNDLLFDMAANYDTHPF